MEGTTPGGEAGLANPAVARWRLRRRGAGQDETKEDSKERRRPWDWVLAWTIDQFYNVPIASLVLQILWDIPGTQAPGCHHGNVRTGELSSCSPAVNISAVSLDNTPPECSEEALKRKRRNKEYLLL